MDGEIVVFEQDGRADFGQFGEEGLIARHDFLGMGDGVFFSEFGQHLAHARRDGPEP